MIDETIILEKTDDLADLLDTCIQRKAFKIAYDVLKDCKQTYHRHDEYIIKVDTAVIDNIIDTRYNDMGL